MQRSAIFSSLLNMDGYGQVNSNLSGAIISDISDWWDKLAKGGIKGEDLQMDLFQGDLYKFVQKYAFLVNLAISDEECLPVDSPENRFNLSIATQKWEIMAQRLIAQESPLQGKADIQL